MADDTTNLLFVLLGRGDGTFQAGPTYPAAQPLGVYVADFNNDGKADIFVFLNSGTATRIAEVFLGNGDGAFRAPLALPSANPAIAGVTFGDFNNDGKLDVV